MSRGLYTLPNLLTLMRIVLVPLLIIVFYLPVSWASEACATIFALAAITDWLDGYLARKLGQVSPFGKFLDPVADKLMVATALILLVQDKHNTWLALAAVVIIGREITISALREWMAEIGHNRKVAVNVYGKYKTAAQMLAIFLMLYNSPVLDIPVYSVGVIFLIIAVALTLWSMFTYLQAAWPSINDNG